MRKLKIAISGIIYPLWMGSYFWRALERRNDVELFVIGPYTGDWIPWNGGMKVESKYVKVPDVALPSNFIGSNIPFELVKSKVPSDIDLWIQIDAGFHFANRPSAAIVAHVQTDPHVLKASYQRPRSYSDLNFCMQLEYMQPGEFYLPYAFDPTVFYPENIDKSYEACLIGLHYPDRTKLVEALRAKNYRVLYSIGEVYDEFRVKYNQSMLALNVSSLKDLNARTFEAFGMLVPLVTNRIPDLKNFFVEDDHYLGFDTIPEAVEKVEWALNNYALAMSMALNSYQKVIAGHTWDHRISSILDYAKLR